MTGIIADLILLQVKNLNLAVSQSKKNIVNSINFGMLAIVSILNTSVME